MPDPVVAICIPMYKGPTYQFWQSFNGLLKPGKSIPGLTHLIHSQGFLIQDARRIMTADALQYPDITHLLWIDDDMVFPQDALKRLLDYDKDVVGGLCHNRRSPYNPILARLIPDEWGYPPETYGFCYDYTPNTLFEVDATGGAFLLMKRKVLDDITTKFGPLTWWKPENTESEDFAFCRKTKSCGYKIFVDTGLDIGHVAEVVINRDTSSKLRPHKWHAWLPPMKEAGHGKPIASVIIPTYNQNPKYLMAAVRSALNQTVPVEVIVVDDGTTDYDLIKPDWASSGDVPKVVLPSEVKLIKQANKGISGALNTGIATMSTDWFCWLSSDDLFTQDKVETQLKALKTAQAKAGYHGYGIIDDVAGRFSRYALLPSWKTQQEQNELLSYGCPINGSTVMIHKNVFDRVGLFDTKFKFGQDWELWCRIGRAYFWYQTNEILGTRREGKNLTAQIAANPDSEAFKIRNAEDTKIREMYKL